MSADARRVDSRPPNGWYAMSILDRLVATPTRVATLLGLVCTTLVGASFFVQHVLGIEPCPLCIVQRFTYVGLIPVFVGAALLRDYAPAQRFLFWTAGALTLGGIGVAGYQTYLQLFPAPVVAQCSASLSYMLDSMALTEVLARVLNAPGDCSDTSFKVLGLTLAQASLLTFLSFSLLLAMTLHRRSAAAAGAAVL